MYSIVCRWKSEIVSLKLWTMIIWPRHDFISTWQFFKININPSTISFFKCWKPPLNYIHTWTISFLFTLSWYFQFKGKCFTLPESTQLSSTTNKKETGSGFYPQAKNLRQIFRTWLFVSRLHWITSTLGQSTPHTDDLSCSLRHVHRHLALRCTHIPSLLDLTFCG